MQKMMMGSKLRFVVAGAISISAGELPAQNGWEDYQFSDQSMWSVYRVDSTPGVIYQVQSSDDLLNWTNNASFYGAGQEILFPMFERIPAPAGGPAPSPQTGDRTMVTLFLNPSTTTGETILRWHSIEGGFLLSKSIPAVLHSSWFSEPIFCAASTTSDFDYFIMTSSSALPTPPEFGSLPPVDEGFLSAFLADLTQLETSVIQGQISRSLSPQQPAEESGPHAFLRISQDWTRDTDGDGIPDWAEFEMASNPLHPSATIANPFNADNNGDSVPDGEQADFDQDGIPDEYDVEKEDANIDWSNSPFHTSPRFASFQIPAPEAPEGADMTAYSPLGTNDFGDVLFGESYLRAGVSQPLVTETPKVEYCRAWGMSNNGLIIGAGTLKPDPDKAITPEIPRVVVVWKDHTASPVPALVKVNDDDVLALPLFIDELDPTRYPPDNLIDSAGRFFANVIEEGQPPRRTLWTFDAGSSTFSFGNASFDDLSYVADPGISWGHTDGGTRVEGIGNSTVIPQSLVRFGFRPGMRPTAFDGASLINPDRGWETSTIQQVDALDCSGSGAISCSSILWNNGNREPFAISPGEPERVAAAPQLSADWLGIRHIDTSPAGWYLGRLDIRNTNLTSIPTLINIPVTVSDPWFCSGVDYHSPASSKPGVESKGRYWIMIPAGGSADAIIKCPATAENPIVLENPAGILPASITLTAPETTVSFTCTLTDKAQLSPNFRMGNVNTISSPIGYKVMKNHTVRVALWHVSRPNVDANNQPFIDGPEIVFTKEELEAELNDVFTPQINATFVVDVKDPITVDWDQEWRQGMLPNDSFDVVGNVGAITPEQAVVAAVPNRAGNVDINIYVIGGHEGGEILRPLGFTSSSFNPEDQSFETDHEVNLQGGALGVTDVNNRICWILGSLPDKELPRMAMWRALMKRTVAHEIGHILLGPGHPNPKDRFGPGPELIGC